MHSALCIVNYELVYPKTLDEAEALINGLMNFERVDVRDIRYGTTDFDLGAFADWLGELDLPQDAPDTVFHVVGTKGKGSTCTLLAAALTGIGVRTGLYASPHLHHINERICIDGAAIAPVTFCRLTADLIVNLRTRLHTDDTRNVGMRSAFELLTAMALCEFRTRRCRAAVVEAGLGGRLDATNVFRSPQQKLVNVIMPIGAEHTGILGNTIAEIAAEKAAVIQPHTHGVILARQPDAHREAVERTVRERMASVGCGAPLVMMNDCAAPQLLDEQTNRWRFAVNETTTVEATVALAGEHQAWNTLAALHAIASVYGAKDLQRAASAMQAAQLSGRFEQVCGLPRPVVVDGAHCVLSARAMVQTWHALYGEQCPPPVIVCGFMADKKVAEILDIVVGELRPYAAYACAPLNPRALPASETTKLLAARMNPANVRTEPDVQAGIAAARVEMPDYPLLVFGSLSLVQPAKAVSSEKGV